MTATRASITRRCVVFFVALLFWTIAGEAHAEEATITARLEWQAEDGAGCIDAAALANAVNARWGRDVFVAGPKADVVVHGVARRSGHGYTTTIELIRDSGQSLGSRTLETREKDCKALDDSVALAVGLMLDVSRARVAEERRNAPPATEPVARPVAGPPLQIPRPAEVPAARVHFEPWLGGELALGLLPLAAFGVRAGVAIVPPAFARFEFGATLYFPMDAHEANGRGVTSSAFTVDLGLCVDEWTSERLALEGCVTERAGRIRGEGFGFSETAAASEFLFDAGIRQALRLRLSENVGLRAGAYLAVPLVRYRFVFDDAASNRRAVYEMSAISGGGELGAVFLW